MALRLGDVAQIFLLIPVKARSIFTSGSVTAGRFCSRIRRTSRPSVPRAWLYGRPQAEFEKRNCKIIGLSADPVSDHKNWAKTSRRRRGMRRTTRSSATRI